MGHTIKTTIDKIQRSTYLSIPEPILIGVSGGADSIALLHMIQSYRLEQQRDPTLIHILTCDHNTRENTKKEIETVRNSCQNNTFFTILYTGTQYDEKHLRKRRHQQFVDYVHQHNIKKLVLGHHLDDRIETTLLNIQRGCHLPGLIALQDQATHFLDTTITILRPLLNTPKSELISYCLHYNLSYHHDTSNDDPTISQRNKLRSIINNDIITPNRHQSFRHLYNNLEQISNKSKDIEHTYYKIPTEYKHQYLCTIPSGSRTSDHLAILYTHYDITINPRSTTLATLSKNLNSQSGAKINYAGLTIKAYQYASVVIVG